MDSDLSALEPFARARQSLQAIEELAAEQRSLARIHEHLPATAAEKLDRLGEAIAAELSQLREQLAILDSAQIALQAANEAVIASRQQTSALLAAASHDLLQPLSAARIFLSTLAQMRFRPQSRELVERANGALISTEALLGSLLEISSIDAGGMKPEVTSFPISSLLITLASEFEPLAARKGLSLRIVLSTTRVQSDIRLLRRIIQNLMSNAVRYTSSGKVLVGCRHRRDGLRIEVRDTGSGIPDKELANVFREFHRLDPSKVPHDQGMGLGLTIVQRLADILGHPLLVESQPGKGSLFAVTVRYGRAMSALRPNDLVPLLKRPLLGKVILVVENDEGMLEAMKTLLASWGCRPIIALSATRALVDLARLALSPDVVVADYHLEGETGLDVIARIKQAYGSAVPAVIVSADRRPELRSLARRARSKILTKPVEPSVLLEVLARLVSDRQFVSRRHRSPQVAAPQSQPEYD